MVSLLWQLKLNPLTRTQKPPQIPCSSVARLKEPLLDKSWALVEAVKKVPLKGSTRVIKLL